jgi:hypothetical protein
MMLPDLAWYNMMRSRGVMFESTVVERMERVQAEWNQAWRAELEGKNEVTETPTGDLIITPRRRRRWWHR